jgi:hypothetical protein
MQKGKKPIIQPIIEQVIAMGNWDSTVMNKL